MSYSTKEVKGLIKNYHTLVEAKGTHNHGLNILLRLADLERAYEALDKNDRFLSTIVALTLRGETTREIGSRINLSHVAIQNRLGSAIDWMVKYLNEGVTD